MNRPTLAFIVSLGTLVGGSVLAQEQTPAIRPAQPVPAPAQTRAATPPPAPAATTAATTPRKQSQPVNVRIDLSITDQRGGSAPIKRTLSVVVADGYHGSVRSQSAVAQIGNIPLNVDADPELLADGKVRLLLNVQYDWPAPDVGRDAARGVVLSTSLHDSVALILQNGQSAIAAQSADPIGDRQVTVEVKATILK